jgi:hypothetical protein
MAFAEYDELKDDEEVVSEEITEEKIEEKEEEVSSALEEKSISCSAEGKQGIVINRAPFLSITTSHPSIFTHATPTPELSPLLLTGGPRLPSALLSHTHRRPAFRYDALHHATYNPLPVEQEADHYLPAFADLSSLRRGVSLSFSAELKSSRFSQRRREQMRDESRKKRMLRRETLVKVKQAEIVKRRAEQEGRERVEQAENAADELLSVAWSVGRC